MADKILPQRVSAFTAAPSPPHPQLLAVSLLPHSPATTTPGPPPLPLRSSAQHHSHFHFFV